VLSWCICCREPRRKPRAWKGEGRSFEDQAQEVDDRFGEDRDADGLEVTVEIEQLAALSLVLL
jgi:hypothetical protein